MLSSGVSSPPQTITMKAFSSSISIYHGTKLYKDISIKDSTKYNQAAVEIANNDNLESLKEKQLALLLKKTLCMTTITRA